MSFSYDDITPVKLNEEQPQLCQILYSDEFKSTMGTLLALMQKNEISERALALTTAGIELLASHYSIWIYRYELVCRLGKDLIEELDFLEEISLENEKNYQIWNYRQLIIEQVIKTKGSYDYHREFPIFEAMLSEDTKNHHVWTYRKWFVKKFGLYENDKETSFTENMINMDLKNNSAWSHRFFLKFSRPEAINSELMDSELEFVKDKIKESPQNESSWNYLLGIVAKCNLQLKVLESFCKEFVNTEGNLSDDDEIDLVKSSYALETLAKISVGQEAVKFYDLLIDKYDPIRKNYWQYLKSQAAH